MRRCLAIWLAVAFTAIPLSGLQREGDAFADARRGMVDTIRADVRLTARAIGERRLAPGVMQAMGEVPRHRFVSSELRPHAYENRPLPIGHGQTISQPYIVALMTHLLEPEEGDVILEVGTGSGYQAAVLAELVKRVYSVEIIPALGDQASRRLERLGYENVQTKTADGYFGWPEHGPFDGIVVTAAAGHIPPPLVEQLVPGGKMIIPVGPRFMTQQLTVVTKTESGQVRTRQLLPVAFVPLTGEH